MSAIRLGLIGAGHWGQCYIKTITQLDGVSLEKLSTRQKNLKSIIPDSCSVIPDWRNLIASQDLDGIIIASSSYLHYEMAKAAIEAGKPVLIEKPVALKHHEAQHLISLAKENNVPVLVGHTHLYSHAYQNLKRLSSETESINFITSIGGNWGPFREDVSALWDYAPHDIAFCLDLYDEFPVSVEAEITKDEIVSEGHGQNFKIKLDFNNGKAEIEVGNLFVEKRRKLDVRTVGDCFLYDDLSETKLVSYRKLSSNDINYKSVSIDSSLPLSNLVNKFCEFIKKGEFYEHDILLGANVIAVLELCEKSINS